MTRALIILLFVMSLMLAACSLHLREYDASTASEDFQSDLSAGRLTALSVCDFACMTPGFPMLRHMYCYSESVSTRTIDSTGDMIRNDRHWRRKEKAHDYAEAYNSRLLGYLQDSGIGSCPLEEDWDSAFDDLHKLFASEEDIRVSIGAPYSLDGFFQIDANNDVNWTTLPTDTCQVFARNGIDREVKIEAVNTDQRDGSLVFRCRGGIARLSEIEN